MNARLVALDEGPDIDLDRAMVVVGRHPACDVRLDSLRVSRHHCCMTPDGGELLIRDLGSTNGIRINGERVEIGRLRIGDELAIAHIRYRMDAGLRRDGVLSDPLATASSLAISAGSDTQGPAPENELAAAVRRALPPSVAHRCKIEVIVRMDDESVDAQRPTPLDIPEPSPRDEVAG
jgi:hypothetical protein